MFLLTFLSNRITINKSILFIYCNLLFPTFFHYICEVKTVFRAFKVRCFCGRNTIMLIESEIYESFGILLSPNENKTGLNHLFILCPSSFANWFSIQLLRLIGHWGRLCWGLKQYHYWNYLLLNSQLILEVNIYINYLLTM